MSDQIAQTLSAGAVPHCSVPGYGGDSIVPREAGQHPLGCGSTGTITARSRSLTRSRGSALGLGAARSSALSSFVYPPIGLPGRGGRSAPNFSVVRPRRPIAGTRSAAWLGHRMPPVPKGRRLQRRPASVWGEARAGEARGRGHQLLGHRLLRRISRERGHKAVEERGGLVGRAERSPRCTRSSSRVCRRRSAQPSGIRCRGFQTARRCRDCGRVHRDRGHGQYIARYAMTG